MDTPAQAFPIPAAGPGTLPDRTVTLPVCGQTATLLGRPLKGRDAIQAQRYAAKDGDVAGGYAMLAAIVTVDGKQLVYEDVLDMDTRDISALWAALVGDPRFPNLTAVGGEATGRPSS